jgi:hypothetical protein
MPRWHLKFRTLCFVLLLCWIFFSSLLLLLSSIFLFLVSFFSFSMKKKGVAGRGGGSSVNDADPLAATFSPLLLPADRTTLMQIRAQSEALQRRIDEIDDRIFALETTYLRDAAEIGSLFDGFGTSPLVSVRPPSGSATVRRRGTFTEADRIFSASSGTSAPKLRKRMRDLETGVAPSTS